MKRILVPVLLLTAVKGWGALAIEVSIGTSKSNTTSDVSPSTTTAAGNELVLIFCQGNTSTVLIPTTTITNLTISTVTTSPNSGFTGIWAACPGSAFTSKTFTCSTVAAASQSIYLLSFTGSACSPLNPLGAIGATTACTGTSGTTTVCGSTSTVANSWEVGSGQDASNGDTLSTDANETFLIKYTTDTFSANSSWALKQNSTTASWPTVANSSATGVTSGGGSISQTVAEIIPARAPFVSTLAPTSITGTIFTGNGTVYTGGAALSDCGVCYNTAGYPTTSDTCMSNGTSEGTFAENFTGLTPCTTYHIRAYGTNANGTTYGTDIPFQASCGQSLFTTLGTGNLAVSNGTGVMTVQ